MTKLCGDSIETDEDSYYLYLLCLVVLTLLIIPLLVFSIYQSVRARQQKNNIRVMWILYIVMQIVALFRFVNELVLGGIDPLTHIIRDTIWCSVLPYSYLFVPGIFFGLYLLQILFRLKLSFDGSYLEISRWTLYTLGVMVLIIPMLSTISLLIDDYDDVGCVQTWNAPDFSRPLAYCTVPSTELFIFKSNIVLIVVALINMLNITFGVIFCLKLHQFVKMTQSAESSDPFKILKFQALIIKICILTLTGSISTTLGFMLFGFSILFLHFDAFINCVVIGLMFSCNEWYYKRLCGPCVLLCFRWGHPFRSGKLKVMSRRISWWNKQVTRYIESEDVNSPQSASMPDVSPRLGAEGVYSDSTHCPESQETKPSVIVTTSTMEEV